MTKHALANVLGDGFVFRIGAQTAAQWMYTRKELPHVAFFSEKQPIPHLVKAISTLYAGKLRACAVTAAPTTVVDHLLAIMQGRLCLDSPVERTLRYTSLLRTC